MRFENEGKSKEGFQFHTELFSCQMAVQNHAYLLNSCHNDMLNRFFQGHDLLDVIYKHIKLIAQNKIGLVLSFYSTPQTTLLFEL